jgi:uncharacterized protein (DUF2336 family)
MATWSREVIAQLIEEGSWTARAKVLERLATRFAEGQLEEAEWHAVTDAFRIALYDAEPLVRRVLAESVKSAESLPSDILLALARDTAAVAVPILRHSPLLSDEHLLPIMLGGTTGHRFAVAGRPLVSAQVADALLRFDERSVILHLLGNDGAMISEAALHRLLDHHPDWPALAEAIAKRRLLPVSIGARLVGGATRRGEAVDRRRPRFAGLN